MEHFSEIWPSVMCLAFPPPCVENEIRMKAHLQITLAVDPSVWLQVSEAVVEVLTWGWERYRACSDDKAACPRDP